MSRPRRSAGRPSASRSRCERSGRWPRARCRAAPPSRAERRTSRARCTAGTGSGCDPRRTRARPAGAPASRSHARSRARSAGKPSRPATSRARVMPSTPQHDRLPWASWHSWSFRVTPTSVCPACGEQGGRHAAVDPAAHRDHDALAHAWPPRKRPTAWTTSATARSISAAVVSRPNEKRTAERASLARTVPWPEGHATAPGRPRCTRRRARRPCRGGRD